MGLMLIRPNDMKAVYGDTYKYAACEPPYWAGVIASYARERDVSVDTGCRSIGLFTGGCGKPCDGTETFLGRGMCHRE